VLTEAGYDGAMQIYHTDTGRAFSVGSWFHEDWIIAVAQEIDSGEPAWQAETALESTEP
jgi:hypothetical protein